MIHVDPVLVAPVPATAPADAPAPARALIERQLAMLSRLAEIGMEIAEAAGRQAVAEARSAGAGEGAAPATGQWRDPGLAFARVARAVRMTIALQSRLCEDLAALDRADEQAQARRTMDRRLRLGRLVSQAAEAAISARRAAGREADHAHWDETIGDEIERLSSDAYERLRDAEDGDLGGLSFDEAVATICKDLGLSPEWTTRLRWAVAPPPDGAGDALEHVPSEAPRAGVGPGPAVEPPPDPPPPLSARIDEYETGPATPPRTPP